MNTLFQDRPRVLIVDDQKNWREALHDMLDTMFEAETATSYDEAKRKLRERAFHVLVADQRLVDAEKNNIQGILLLDEVSRLQDGTQAIIVTGYPTIEAAKKALRGRDAYDYLLKYPEEGGPFNIRQFREQVGKAAEEAMGARESARFKELSMKTLISGLDYGEITSTLIGDTIDPNAPESVRKVLDWILYPLQPLAHQMSRVWLLKSDQVCEILCWSRMQGSAALIRISEEHMPVDSHQTEWIGETWQLAKKEQFASTPIVGISYMIDGMSFADCDALVKEE